MKTSTIILVSFLVIVFLTPLFIALALKRKISNSEYKTIKYEIREAQRNLKMGDFKVLSIKSNSSGLNFSIIKDDSSFVASENWMSNHIVIKERGDTVHIMYTDNTADQRDGDNLNIQIHVQNPGAIITENASLEIVPHHFYTSHPLEINVRNEARLIFVNSPIAKHDDGDINQDSSSNNLSFNDVTITSDKAEVRLSSSLKIDKLTLNINNKSKLVLPAGIRFQQLNAAVSDDTEVQAPWYVVKAFKNNEGNN